MSLKENTFPIWEFFQILQEGELKQNVHFATSTFYKEEKNPSKSHITSTIIHFWGKQYSEYEEEKKLLQKNQVLL